MRARASRFIYPTQEGPSGGEREREWWEAGFRNYEKTKRSAIGAFWGEKLYDDQFHYHNTKPIDVVM